MRVHLFDAARSPTISPPPHCESTFRRVVAANRLSFPSRASIRSSIFECCAKIGGWYLTNADATNSKFSTRPVAVVSRARSSRPMFAYNGIARCCSTCRTASRPKGCETSSYKPTCAERNAAVRTAAASKTPRRCSRKEGAANSHTVGAASWETMGSRHPDRPRFCKFPNATNSLAA